MSNFLVFGVGCVMVGCFEDVLAAKTIPSCCAKLATSLVLTWNNSSDICRISDKAVLAVGFKPKNLRTASTNIDQVERLVFLYGIDSKYF